MNDDRITELVHGEIDGVNSPEESAELRRKIMRDPAARELHDDMKQLTDALDRMGEEESPADLRDSILEALPNRSRTESTSTHEVPSPTRWHLPAALAAGLVLGLIIGPLVINDSAEVDPSDVVGTIGSRLTEPVELDADRFSGTFRGVQNDTRILVTFDVEAQGPVEVTLEYDPTAVDLTGFARRGGRFAVVEARDGRFIVEAENDFRGNLNLERITPATTALQLTIARDGEVIGSDSLRLEGKK